MSNTYPTNNRPRCSLTKTEVRAPKAAMLCNATIVQARLAAGIQLFIFSMLGFHQHSVAQEAIDTNRPGFSSSPYVLKPGTWQIETGIDYERDDDRDDSSTVILPLAQLRYGLMDEIELTLDWAGVARTRSGGDTSTGITDANVGVKIELTNNPGRTAAALIAGLSVHRAIWIIRVIHACA